MDKIYIHYYLDDEHHTDLCSCEVLYVAPVGSTIWLHVDKTMLKGKKFDGEYIVKKIDQCIFTYFVKNKDTYPDEPKDAPITKTREYLEVFLTEI